jgi:hypothetical protein
MGKSRKIKRGSNQRKSGSSFARKRAPTGVFLILVMLLVLGWASLRANAAWQFLAARSIAAPMLEGGADSQLTVEAAVLRVENAMRFFPNQPDYLDLAGQLQELKAIQSGVVGTERRDLLHSAADFYRRALSVRPLWPYSWANLLGVKDRLGEVDSEFRLAISRSVETGPWEPRVQMQVISSGLRYWDQLGGSSRELVRGKVVDALKVQPREVFEMVRDFGRADLVCSSDTGYEQIERWCLGILGEG